MKLVRDLPRHGSSSLRDDDDHRPTALKEMAREQSLVMQLRAVVLPAIQADDERSEVIAHMFETILDCSAKAMTALKLLLRDVDRRVDDVEAVDEKMGVRKLQVFSDDDNAKPHRLRKRRRLADDCVTLETPVPHYDGHQWRKYGQKYINHAKHPRSYYRCTYKQEQNCKATKTVQQQDGGASSPDDSNMYSVVYYGQHICKPVAETDSGSTGTTHSSNTSSGGVGRSDGVSLSHQLGNNISVTCTTSVVVDGTTSSLESNNSKQLMDMAEEYLTASTAEGNKNDVMLDVAAYAPLDFDMAWDWPMDAHVGDYLYC